jgi:hypothetical protein
MGSGEAWKLRNYAYLAAFIKELLEGRGIGWEAGRLESLEGWSLGSQETRVFSAGGMHPGGISRR